MQCDEHPHASVRRSHGGEGGRPEELNLAELGGFTAHLWVGFERMSRWKRREGSGPGVGNTDCTGRIVWEGKRSQKCYLTTK